MRKPGTSKDLDVRKEQVLEVPMAQLHKLNESFTSYRGVEPYRLVYTQN